MADASPTSVAETNEKPLSLLSAAKGLLFTVAEAGIDKVGDENHVRAWVQHKRFSTGMVEQLAVLPGLVWPSVLDPPSGEAVSLMAATLSQLRSPETFREKVMGIVGVPGRSAEYLVSPNVATASKIWPDVLKLVFKALKCFKNARKDTLNLNAVVQCASSMHTLCSTYPVNKSATTIVSHFKTDLKDAFCSMGDGSFKDISVRVQQLSVIEDCVRIVVATVGSRSDSGTGKRCPALPALPSSAGAAQLCGGP